MQSGYKALEPDDNPFVSLLSGNLSQFEFPIKYRVRYGKDYTDILDTGTAMVYLISDTIKETFSVANLTGWTTFPVEILDKADNKIVGYHGLSITGRSGEIDYTKSGVIEKKLVPQGPISKYYKGLFPDMTHWDGSDLFLAKGYYGIIMTAEAASIVRKRKFSNVKIQPLSEIEINEFTVETALKNRTK